ncbi:MAG: amino-acid N-acetyltransferase [Gemmataceae bacterium]
MNRLTQLREILRYVPRFKDRVFVISMDGAVVEDENFRNLLLDIALLRSLNIGVVLVHGAAHQITRLAQRTGETPTNLDGSGLTDDATLQLALFASTRVSYELVEGLDAADLRGATGNFLVAHPAGILGGVDYRHTGKVERVNGDFLLSTIAQGVIPVVPPVASDGEGSSYRLNSDVVAVDVAAALKAAKLIYLNTHPGVVLPAKVNDKVAEALKPVLTRHPPEEGKARLIRSMSVEEAETLLRSARELMPQEVATKVEQGVRAVRLGVPRVHIIDGRMEEGLLAEVFSNLGVGTMVHANEYQSIRPAKKSDSRTIMSLIADGVAAEELVRRTRTEIERQSPDFFVFEVDRTPVACAAVHLYPTEKKAELACVCVDPRFENRGIGSKMMQYAEAKAREAGMDELFCLSTQTFNYFQNKGGFLPGSVESLPPGRREKYDKSGRHSLVLIKKLAEPKPGPA